MVIKRDSEKEKKAFKIRWVSEAIEISKQAYYRRITSDKYKEIKNDKVVQLITGIRKRIPKIGTRKLIDHLKEKCVQNGIKMERDALFFLLKHRGLFI